MDGSAAWSMTEARNCAAPAGVRSTTRLALASAEVSSSDRYRMSLFSPGDDPPVTPRLGGSLLPPGDDPPVTPRPGGTVPPAPSGDPAVVPGSPGRSEPSGPTGLSDPPGPSGPSGSAYTSTPPGARSLTTPS